MKEPPTIAILSARLARAFPSLSTYSAAVLAAELEAVERAQRRHAERCCNGADGGYVKWVDAPPRGLEKQHDPDAEERAGKRIEARVAKWGKSLAERSRQGIYLTPMVTLQHDPRGPVLLLKLPGEAEALAV